MNGEKNPTCQQADKTNQLSNQTVNQLFFSLYGKIALWPNSYVAKMFAMKVLTAKMLVAKIFMVKLPKTTINNTFSLCTCVIIQE